MYVGSAWEAGPAMLEVGLPSESGPATIEIGLTSECNQRRDH